MTACSMMWTSGCGHVHECACQITANRHIHVCRFCNISLTER